MSQSDISISRLVPLGPISDAFLQSAVRFACRAMKLRTTALNIVFLDDRRIKKINAKFLGHRWATDVITFPLELDPAVEAEVYISVETARSNARTYGVSLRSEIARLLIHAVLHLSGYDDTSASAADRMKQREDELVRGFFKAQSRR